MSREDRTGFIGASDAGVILGLSPFKTAHQLFLEKTGQTPPEDENFHMELGALLEDDVLELFARRRNVSLEPSERIAHPTFPWLSAQIDALATVDGERVVVEAKHAAIKRDEGWGRDGTSDVPAGYFAQVQVQMFVQRARAGADGTNHAVKAFVPCLFLNGKTFNIFEVPYDAEMAQGIVRRLAEFWKHCEAKAWPEEVTHV